MTSRIVIDPNVCGGRPIVAGTRMRVSDVLDALASSVSVDELLEDFPYLTREDVHACLAYGARAVDHTVVQAA
ncbi:DUF433 domain-containing protein [Sphingobium ummariense]